MADSGIPQRAVPPDLVVVREEPLNAESPLAQQLGVITPVERFYVRNHFTPPSLESMDTWRLEVGGAARRPLSLSLSDLMDLPARSAIVTLECAGNGRRYLQPPVPGEPWSLGAVSTAEWVGVPLAQVLERSEPLAEAREALFRGADRGPSPVDGATIAFERSLPLELALRPEVLLVYAMNGAPLTPEHGAPLRLLVPGWYGMASVKWLERIELLREPFQGPFQVARYVYDSGDGATPEPVRWMRPRALIVRPAEGERVPRRGLVVRGYAWSGGAPLERVELSLDGGATWAEAELDPPSAPHAWCAWRYPWQPEASGPRTLVARAWDASGAAQPLEPAWNRLGYGNNGVQRVQVRVTDD